MVLCLLLIENKPVFLNGLEFRVTPHTFRNQPGKLSLTLKCVSTISNLDMNPRYTEGRHQKESTHFSLGSLFNSGKFEKRSTGPVFEVLNEMDATNL